MDYYQLLGVDRSATPDQIKKAYRTLANKHHPDKGGDEEMFKKVNQAYETLSDPNKKRDYDNPQSPNNFNFNGSNNVSPEDLETIFNTMFGGRSPFGNFGGFGFNRQQQQHKQVYRTQLMISLQDAYNGNNHVLNIQTPSENKTVKIDIPKGIMSGSQIRYENVIENATLVIEFRVMPDLKYDRNGNDLYSNHPVSVLDLIVGGSFDFVTISGKKLSVAIPAKTQPNKQLRIVGQGMPIQGLPNVYGDQIILLKPFVPDNISDEVIQCIQRFKTN